MRVTKLLLFLLLLVAHRGSTAAVTYNVSYSFHVPAEWGTLSVENANCCPYAAFPRNRTSRLMTLPSAIGLGVQKGGSTSLSRYMSRHENYSMSSPKETHFFDKGPKTRQLSDYSRVWRGDGNADSIRFDFTPSYLWIPFAACRIKHVFSNMRFMMVLRDPAERAYSEFTMVRTRCRRKKNHMCNWIHSPFLKYARIGIGSLRARGCAFDDGGEKNGSPKSWNDCFQCLLYGHQYRPLCKNRPYLFHLGNNKRQCFHFGAQFVSRGLYAAQLAWWFELFDPQNFLIINSNEFFKDTLGELEKVNAFFGVEEKFKKWMTQSKGMSSNYRKFSDPDKEETLALLRAYYYRPNQELYRLLHETGHGDFAPFENKVKNLTVPSNPEMASDLPPPPEDEDDKITEAKQLPTAEDSWSATQEVPASLPAAETEDQVLSADQSVPDAILLMQIPEPKIGESAENETTPGTVQVAESEDQVLPAHQSVSEAASLIQKLDPKITESTEPFDAVDNFDETPVSVASSSDEEVNSEHPDSTVRAVLHLTGVRRMPKTGSSSYSGGLSWPHMMLLSTIFIVVVVLVHRRFR